MRQPDFDLDFRDGQQGELFVAWIIECLRKGTAEVKTDRRAILTGNLYIETECLRGGQYRDSGIRESHADCYVFVVGQLALAVPTESLRAMVNSGQFREGACKNGSNPTNGTLIPIRSFVDWMRKEATSGRE